MNIAVLASGRGSNLQSIIDSVESGEIKAKIAVVISNVKDAKALDRAKEHGIDAVFVDPAGHETREDYDREIIKVLEKYDIGLVLLAGYMRILSSEFVKRYESRMMNIHPSLLPAFGGGTHAQRDAWEWGAKVSGCTVHFVTDDVDAGPIIIQRAVPVEAGDTPDTLAAKILNEEHKVYPEAVRLFVDGRLSVEGRRVVVKDAD